MVLEPVREWSLFMAGGPMEKGGDIEFECKQLEASFECERFSEFHPPAVNNDHSLMSQV